MLIAKAEKTDLLHLGVREWEAQRADVVPTPEADGCVLVWHDKLEKLPDVVVVEDDGMQKFFAWMTTYVPHLTPLTALVEVREHRGCANFSTGEGVRHASDQTLQDAALMRGYLGIVHAEVAAAFQASHAPLTVGMAPYISTFSWLALQRESSNLSRVPLYALRETWDEARRLLNAGDLGYFSEDAEEVWTLITGSDNPGQNRHMQQVAEFLNSVRSGKPSFEVLDVAQEHSRVLERLQSSPLEFRVEVFRNLVQSLYERREPPAGHAVVLGFALSLISQGSFSHVGLLGPSRVTDVRPLLWYGWFDFYRHASEAASPSAAAASLQLLRATRKSCSSWRCQDIAIDELRVLSRQNDPFAECLLDLRQPVRVGIVDDVVSLIQPGLLRGRARNQQRSLFNKSP